MPHAGKTIAQWTDADIGNEALGLARYLKARKLHSDFAIRRLAYPPLAIMLRNEAPIEQIIALCNRVLCADLAIAEKMELLHCRDQGPGRPTFLYKIFTTRHLQPTEEERELADLGTGIHYIRALQGLDLDSSQLVELLAGHDELMQCSALYSLLHTGQFCAESDASSYRRISLARAAVYMKQIIASGVLPLECKVDLLRNRLPGRSETPLERRQRVSHERESYQFGPRAPEPHKYLDKKDDVRLGSCGDRPFCNLSLIDSLLWDLSLHALQVYVLAILGCDLADEAKFRVLRLDYPDRSRQTNMQQALQTYAQLIQSGTLPAAMKAALLEDLRRPQPGAAKS
jgi:hypothetical protein